MPAPRGKLRRPTICWRVGLPGLSGSRMTLLAACWLWLLQPVLGLDMDVQATCLIQRDAQAGSAVSLTEDKQDGVIHKSTMNVSSSKAEKSSGSLQNATAQLQKDSHRRQGLKGRRAETSKDEPRQEPRTITLDLSTVNLEPLALAIRQAGHYVGMGATFFASGLYLIAFVICFNGVRDRAVKLMGGV
mmetsp:Transcript_91943/g.168605  ORF Transcript_91943/g.168605 Transcript_91943/m.168605 type:complete len:188 (+) Transcript_91943:71-634(+)